MKKFFLSLSLIAGSLAFFASCHKTGPVGPQGPQGPQGNANVIGSDPFDVSNWEPAYADSAWSATFNAPTITQAVADRGIVQVYLYYPDSRSWRNLPDIVQETQFFFRFYAGGFKIFYTTTYGRMPLNPGGPWTFRLVVVAPSQKAAHPNTNWNDYKETMKVLEEDKSVSSQVTTVNVAAVQ